MTDTSRLLAFVATSFVLIIVPGPSVLFVLSRAVAWGRRTALLTVVGNSAGFAAQAATVAVGLGVALRGSALLLALLRLAGAGYLIYLGVHALRGRARLSAVLASAAEVPRRWAFGVARQGFVVGLTNPKTLVFLTAVVPQFVNRSRGHVPCSCSSSAPFSRPSPSSVTAPGAWPRAPPETGSPDPRAACGYSATPGASL